MAGLRAGRGHEQVLPGAGPALPTRLRRDLQAADELGRVRPLHQRCCGRRHDRPGRPRFRLAPRVGRPTGARPRAVPRHHVLKEAALFGTDPELIPVLRERMIHTAPGEPALEALRMIMVSDARAVTDELGELGGNPVDWLRRMKGAHADSQLRAARAAQMAMVERAIAEGLAERLGTDPERDPYPGLLAATAAGVFRASISFWAGSGGTV